MALMALILGVCVYLLYRMKVGLNYRWNWSVIPQYLFYFDSTADKWVPNLLMQGLFTTIRLSIWGTLLATLIGTVLGMFRTSRSLFRRLFGRTYVELIRNLHHKRGLSSILVTHNENVARFCQKTYFMDSGKLILKK